jgi:hypothetical protein
MKLPITKEFSAKNLDTPLMNPKMIKIKIHQIPLSKNLNFRHRYQVKKPKHKKVLRVSLELNNPQKNYNMKKMAIIMNLTNKKGL